MEACVPHAPHRVIRALNEARVPSHYAEATLENFTNLSGNGAEVLRGLRQWLSSFVLGQSKGIILSGAVGVGKTHLLTSVTKTLAMRGVNVRFVDFYQLLAEIRDGYASKQSELDIIQPLVDLDVLVIDEMGKGPSTDWPVSILDQIVDGRDKRRMPIIASTNYTLGPSTGASSRAAIDLEGPAKQFSPDMFTSLEARVGARIYSRLLGMCHTVELKGKDWRRNPSRAGTGTGSAR
jgi:DNA replication protein DnaC